METTVTGMYPFDPSGSSPQNRITKELHTIQYGGNRPFFIPKASPFFAGNVKVYNGNNGNEYKEGTDYILGHIFFEAQESIGKPIYGSVIIINKNLDSLVAIDYNTLGGIWGLDEKTIARELAEQSVNPEQRAWGQIAGLPETFPPIKHQDDISETAGYASIIESLERIVAAVRETAVSGGKDYRDLEERFNKLSKNDVGLSLINNWAPTTEEQARIGSDNASYLTPAMAAILIDHLVGQVIKSHIENDNNPHNDTPKSIGLGNVANYTIATTEEAEAGQRTDRYMTPFLTYLLLKKQVPVDTIDKLVKDTTDHIKAKGNVHDLKASDIDAYTKAEVRSLVTSTKASDSDKFGGMTVGQWKALIPGSDQLDNIITSIDQKVSAATNTASLTPPKLSIDANAYRISSVAPLGKGFMVKLRDGTLLTSRDVALGDINIQGARIFGSGQNTTYYIVKDGSVIEAGAGGQLTRWTIDTALGDIRSIHRRGKFVIVLYYSGTMNVFRVDSGKNITGISPETTVQNVQAVFPDDGSTGRYAYLVNTYAHFIKEDGTEEGVMNLGGMTGGVQEGRYYGTNLALRMDNNPNDTIALYKLDMKSTDLQPSITNTVIKTNTFFGLNDEVFVIYAAALGGLAITPLGAAVERSGYLYLDTFINNITSFAMNGHDILFYDENYGLQWLGENVANRPNY